MTTNTVPGLDVRETQHSIAHMAATLVDLAYDCPGIEILCVVHRFDHDIYQVYNGTINIVSYVRGAIGDKGVFEWDIRYRVMKFKNGARIRFQVSSDPDMARGFECHVCYIERPSYDGVNPQKVEAIIQAYGSRARQRKPDYPNVLYVNDAPRGIHHDPSKA